MAANHELIFMKPIFHEKIWGGRKLASDWGYDIPDGPIGECWAISAHPHGDCQIDGGSFDGMRLSELWQSHRELFGCVPTAEGANAQFPLLVKIIDAKDHISEDTSLDSFISGFRLAWRLSAELNHYDDERPARCQAAEKPGARFTLVNDNE